MINEAKDNSKRQKKKIDNNIGSADENKKYYCRSLI
jgi:hypothetical protein